MSTVIGKIIGSHGVKGDVVLKHRLQGTINSDSWDALLIELLPGSQIPFFIESMKQQSNSSFLIKFEEVNSPEDATAILQKNVFLSPNAQDATIEISTSANDYIGYTLYDKDSEIGLIDNILNPKTNPLFIINDGTENELLIPANEELVLKTDSDNKIIWLDIPEGLI